MADWVDAKDKIKRFTYPDVDVRVRYVDDKVAYRFMSQVRVQRQNGLYVLPSVLHQGEFKDLGQSTELLLRALNAFHLECFLVRDLYKPLGFEEVDTDQTEESFRVELKSQRI